jgi:Phage integrase family
VGAALSADWTRPERVLASITATAALTDEPSGLTLERALQKTGTPVYCPVPPLVVERLAGVKNENDLFFFYDFLFYDGTSQPESMVKSWDRIFQKVFAAAKPAIHGGHPHRFHDTFAVSLLLKGVSIETVSKLLGHSSIKVTEHHYSPWVKARQDLLETEVRESGPRVQSQPEPVRATWQLRTGRRARSRSDACDLPVLDIHLLLYIYQEAGNASGQMGQQPGGSPAISRRRGAGSERGRPDRDPNRR